MYVVDGDDNGLVCAPGKKVSINWFGAIQWDWSGVSRCDRRLRKRHLNRWGGVGLNAVGIGPKLVIRVKDNNKMVRPTRQ